MKGKAWRCAVFAISVVAVLLLMPSNSVFASSGYLKAASIKTCPNGSVYGYHGPNNHWHLAIRSESDGKWRASGAPLSGDPCPSSSTPSGGNSNNSSNSETLPSTPPNSDNSSNTDSSSSSAEKSTPKPAIKPEEEITKSSDKTIKSLRINQKNVPLTASALYFALEGEVLDSLDISLNDPKASYVVSEYNPDFTDKSSAQRIKITVTAEDGSIENYTLNVVKKIPSVGINIWLKEETRQIKIHSPEEKYDLGDVPFWQKRQCFAYELIGDGANAEVSINGETVTDCANLNVGENNIAFKITNKYGDENIATIIIYRQDIFHTILLDIVAHIILLAMLTLTGYILRALWQKYIKTKRKKSTFEHSDINFKDFALKTYAPPFVIIRNEKDREKSSGWLKAWCIFWAIIVIAQFAAVFGGNAQISRNLSDYEKDSTYYSFLAEYPDAPVVEEQDETDQEQTATEGDSNVEEGAVSNNNESSVTSSINNSTSATPLTAPRNNDPMSGIRISEATNDVYVRNEYQPDWNIGSGCNIRARILQTTSIISVQTSNGCTVTYGSWYDPYTGKTLTGNPYRGDGTENDLDIDHIIPLKYVNSHGGSSWSNAQKRAYGASLSAMNNGVYLAVSASENRRKGDKGPSEYYPPNSAYRCTYAQKWRDTARIYSIALSSADYDVVRSVLEVCGIK